MLFVKLAICTVVLVINLAKDWPRELGFRKSGIKITLRMLAPLLLAVVLFTNDILDLFDEPPITKPIVASLLDAQSEELVLSLSDSMRSYYLHICADSIEVLNQEITERDRRSLGLLYEKYYANDWRGVVTLAQAFVLNHDTGCQNVEALNLASISFSELKVFDSALLLNSLALSTEWGNSQLWTNRGRIEIGRGRFDSAIVCFDSAIRLDDSSYFAHFYRAYAREHLDDLAAAESDLLRVVEIDSSFGLGWFNLSVIRRKRGDIAEAESLLKRCLKADSLRPEPWSALGKTYQKTNRSKLSLECFDKAIQLDSGNSDYWYAKGISLRDLRRYGEALSCYEHAIRIDSSHKRAWNSRGTAQYWLGKPQDALISHNRALSLDSNYSGAWLARSLAMDKLDRKDEALSSVNRAIECESTLAIAWVQKSLLLLHQFSDTVGATNSLRKAAEIDSSLVSRMTKSTQ